MKKGCGCCGFMVAVSAGVVIGVIGLSIAGYYWLNNKVLGDEPVKFERTWTERDAASVPAKLFPAALAHTVGKPSEHQVTLSVAEADFLIQEVILKEAKGGQARIELGDKELTIRFSVPVGADRALVKDNKHLNGELTGRFYGKNGDFEIELTALRLGDFTCPGSLLSWGAYWLRGQLELQKFLADEKFKLTGISHDAKKLELTAQIKGR